MLDGKKVIVAVCGSIAAYKTAFFVRLLIKAGAEVQVVMTDSAKDFIAPLTLSTLSKKPVYSEFIKNDKGEWVNHVDIGLWADLMIIAPLSANTLSKLSHGICDNLLTAVYLSAKCPIMVCPAMDLDMYQHPSTKANLEKIESYGNEVLAARDGELASGLSGEGRMAEPEEILEAVNQHFAKRNSLRNKTFLITSGPTHEAIDPVRFIGNHSTGKMGKAIAKELVRRGAKVEFVTGPTAHHPNHANIAVHSVTTADEMYENALNVYPKVDVAIFTAAVADYKPANPVKEKIKKKDQTMEVKLVPNPDIAKLLGDQKKHQLNIGFALETNDEEKNAAQKLKSKNFDMIVLNSLQEEGAGFAHDTNRVTIFDRDNNSYKYELKSKSEVAKDLIDLIEEKLNA